MDQRSNQTEAAIAVARRIFKDRAMALAGQVPAQDSPTFSPTTCQICKMERGAGWILSEKGAKPCKCRKIAVMKKQLSVIPPKFRWANLHTIKARPDIHQKQPALIRQIRSNPLQSYLLCGRNGAGKTRIGYALFRNGVTIGRRAVACTVRGLLDQYRKSEFPERDDEGAAKFFRPMVTADDLRILNGPKWTLFLEEMDKASASEYAAQELFELLNAARDFEHQLIVTTNLKVDELATHWSKTSRTYGPSIIERLKDCMLVEMF